MFTPVYTIVKLWYEIVRCANGGLLDGEDVPSNRAKEGVHFPEDVFYIESRCRQGCTLFLWIHLWDDDCCSS